MLGLDQKTIDQNPEGMTPLAPMFLAQFDAWVAETPNAAAIIDDRSSRTYSQLDIESRAYSRLLIQNQVGRETVVAIVAERKPQYVATVLGVLRTGAAFMPIEPIMPVSRAQLMCSTAGVRVIFVQPGHERYASELIAGWEDEAPVILETPAAPPDAAMVQLHPERMNAGLAYVIFTSGSTGVPKGAMVTDGGMNNHLAAKIADLGLSSRDVVGLTAPLSFDISVWQALIALCVGGSVCVASALNMSEPDELVAWVEKHAITILEIVPSFMAVVLDVLPAEKLRSSLRSLRFLIATGEALPIELAQRWYECCPNIPLMNAYGPTECADDVTHHLITEAECRTKPRPPIGRPIMNNEAYVVDERGRETEDGVEGELLIGGRGVGRGYIADPIRTALAFVPDYFSGRPGQRLYRTGDRATRASDGVLDYHGRRDRQVKVRGQRVELGDVESALRRVPGVASAACVLTGDRMRAFVTLRTGSEHLASGNTILDAVRESAPTYLVPQEVTVLDRLPTGASGKVDYRALEGYRSGASPETPATPSDNSERMAVIRAAFAEILGIPAIGDDDNFFMAGGDSLQAMKLMSLVRKRFDTKSGALRGFLLDPTPGGLLSVLENVKQPALDQVPGVEPGVLSSGQERLWLLEQLHPHRGAQLIRLVLMLRGKLDIQALQHALDAVVIRHEPLRTVFSQKVGVPVGTIWPRARIELERTGPGEATRDILQESGLSARTEQPPLAAAQLAEIGPDHYVLRLVLHHLVADGWSLAVLGEDISIYYQRWLDGNKEISLPQAAYSNYVTEERRWLASPEATECEQYWSQQLAGAPLTIDLPLDRPRPDTPDFTANYVIQKLSANETTVLAATARRMGATPFMAVMAAVYITLRELLDSHDFVVGIDTVNRSWTGSDELIGTFVNQLPVRLSLPMTDPTFRDVLALVRTQCLGAYEHERLPFHKIVAAVNPPRRAGRFPLFPIKITQQGAWRSSLNLPGIEVVPDELSEPVTHLDLILDVSGEHDRLRLELLYPPEILNRETAAAWVDAVADALRAGVSDPDAPARVVLRKPRRANGSVMPALRQDESNTHLDSWPGETHVEPATPAETLVAAVWRDVLELDKVSISDNFFEIGGHSLAAAQVVRELAARTGVELELEKFFDLDTLEEIAAEIDRRQLVSQGQDGPHIYEGEL